MKFKTASGTEYLLNNIETIIEATGEPIPTVGPKGIPVNIRYIGNLARIGSPLRDISTGGTFETTHEFHKVDFSSLPEIGYRFTYFHPIWAGCYSTIVTVIEEGESN